MLIAQTERLTLRTMNEDDAAFYLELVNDPLFIKNIRDKGIRNLDAAQEAIRSSHIAIQETHGFSLYLVERKADQTPIGIAGFVKREDLEDIDIGYAFLPAAHQQGYAYESTKCLLDVAKNTLQLKRLVAITSPDNDASSRLLEKLGFTLEGIIPWKEGGEVKFFSITF